EIVTGSLDVFTQKRHARHDLSREEESAFLGMRWGDRRYERNQVMVRAGEELQFSMLWLSGVALRCKYAAEGARQILETNIAGGFIDLHGFILHRLEHEISAASRCDVALPPPP